MLVGASLLGKHCLDFYSVQYTKPCICLLTLSNPIKLVVALPFHRLAKWRLKEVEQCI